MSFANKINNITNQITKSLFKAVPSNDVYKKTNLLQQYIANFTNLIVLAVKSKDNETIRDSVYRLGHNIWNLMLSQLKEVDFKEKKLQIYNEIYNDFKGFGRDIPISEIKDIILIVDRRMDSLVGETNTAFNTAEDQVTQVYKDVFETAFSSKEFFACDCIITSLHEKARNQRTVVNRILIILADLFDIVISYKHNGYSQLYCEKIVSTIESIYIDNAFKENPLTDMEAYYTLIKKTIFHKEPSLLKLVMKSLHNILESQETNTFELKESIYKNLLYAGMYCLEIKSMKCCATLVRYLVTEKFDLKELNCSFVKINFLVTKKTVELENDVFFNLLESFHQSKQDENIFNITKEKRYLLLKFYLVFYSYFKLQLHISIDRIASEYHELSVDGQLQGKIPFYNIRTVLLDLESHSKNWNELFIDQCETFFVQTAKELVAESDLEQLESDIFYSSSTYLKALKPST
ncbi:hypothetical protein LJK87_27735 [Paenibacillus sp. P25]|nr:hypothetical protein LJK87_27735 [Paenibacillus sp. P25]